MAQGRALHFVFKIGDRKAAAKFYRDILGMRVLRHEEFEEGCKATCNGPYDGKWSKTMIGYGPEDNHFVCELTYNYGVSTYENGNDFLGMYIQSSEALTRAEKAGWPIQIEEQQSVLVAPDGYKFYITNKPQPTDRGIPVNHAKAFGRIAFAVPGGSLLGTEEKMKDAGQKIITPYVSLDTPGKATVQVVILADPDGHEICFVGDEGFRELSQVDLNADKLLSEAMEKDKSDEWFAKKGGKASA
ncbi:glyoxalase domain-containing protein 4-like isoform X3 [Penaeus chinensis]|uniref:glyoxalase domain-containing protein 4-like isoform X3 n=1 Tax=Penaeus chinensis TaxID=139456 RepID=UPI001FB78F6C|nr:glyoxalase domain-containing protein 4-like isoform X3 [Penaeus chinensis]